jgi:glutaminase
MQSPIQAYLDNLHQQLKGLHDGQVASYIPELTKANPDGFAICLVTMDGTAYCVGDAEQLFTIQSISKAFVYAASLADNTKAYVARKVGV